MPANRVLLLVLILACLLLASTAAAQAFITAWGVIGVGVAVGSNGDIYVSGQNGLKVFTSGGTPLRQWQLPEVHDYNIAVSASDNVYVGGPVSAAQCAVYRYTSTGTLVTEWPCVGTNLAVDPSGNVYLGSQNSVHVFSPSGVFIRAWPTVGPDGVQGHPDGLAVDAGGDVYVCDIGQYRILKFTNTGTCITQWGSSGTGDGQFRQPVRVAVGPQGTVYVVDNLNCRVQVFSSDGAFITKWGSPGTGPGQFDNPIGIAVDSNGDIYVADVNNRRIQKFGFVPTPVQTATWGALKSRYRGAAQPATQGR